MGLVVRVSFGSGFERWSRWVREPPSRISLRAAPIGVIVPTSTRNIFQSGPQGEPVLNECDPEPSSTPVFGGMRCMQQESEEETDELEGYRDEHVPQEGKEDSGRESFYDHFAGNGGGGGTRRKVNGGSLPIRRDSIGLSRSVGRWSVLLGLFRC